MHTLEEMKYDVIIGLDLIAGLGWEFSFKHFNITWDELVMPMHLGDAGKFDVDLTKGFYSTRDNSPLLKGAEERKKRFWMPIILKSILRRW